MDSPTALDTQTALVKLSGHTTIHKDMNWVSREGVCRERGCLWGQEADKRGYIYETVKGQI